jgi:hypothetical protein
MDILPAIILTKLLHIIFLWFILFVAEKTALDAFITRVYLEERDPPSLRNIVTGAFLADFIVCMVLLAGTYLVIIRTITVPLVGGSRIILGVAVDLLLSWTLSLSACLVIAVTSQKMTCLRFRDDGLRGIRAVFGTSLVMCIFICVVPYFLLV